MLVGDWLGRLSDVAGSQPTPPTLSAVGLSYFDGDSWDETAGPGVVDSRGNFSKPRDDAAIDN